MRVRLAVPILVAFTLTGAAACSSASSDSCGWDLSTPAGVAANQQRLSDVAAWLDGHPGMPAPSPTSEFWHGDCPTSEIPSPPVDEGH